MSSVIPVKIVPPPPSPENLCCNHPVSNNQIKRLELSECVWAENYPEVQQACYLSKVCTQCPPKCCRFKNITSILQEGPTCGLTAISMLFGIPSPSELLHTAKERNYTNNGEMFSAQYLFNLINDIAKQKSKNIECQLFEGRINCAKVENDLQNGACIFVPYDPDFNHAPCLKFGHKAHWALLVGFLITKTDEFFVLSRHGKAKNLAVWSLNALSASNSNLVEFAQPKGYPDMKFLLPEGGIAGDLGLRNRSIIVKGVQAEEIIVIAE